MQDRQGSTDLGTGDKELESDTGIMTQDLTSLMANSQERDKATKSVRVHPKMDRCYKR